MGSNDGTRSAVFLSHAVACGSAVVFTSIGKTLQLIGSETSLHTYLLGHIVKHVGQFVGRVNVLQLVAYRCFQVDVLVASCHTMLDYIVKI